MKKIPKEFYFELAIFCSHYHSGQSSRGYRLLCKLNPRYSSNAEKEAIDTEIYQYLVDNYSNKI